MARAQSSPGGLYQCRLPDNPVLSGTIRDYPTIDPTSPKAWSSMGSTARKSPALLLGPVRKLPTSLENPSEGILLTQVIREPVSPYRINTTT